MTYPGIFRLPLDRIKKAALKHKLVVLLLFTMMVILLYCFMVFFVSSYKNAKRDSEEYLQNSFLVKQDRLETYLSRLDYTAYSIMFSNWVQRFMVIDRIASRAEFQDYQRNVTHFLSSLASVNDDLSFVLISDSTMVWSNNTLHYDTQYDIKKQPWFGELGDRNKYIEYGKSELFSGLGDRWSMTFYYPVISYYNFSPLGYLAINVTGDNLRFLVSNTGDSRSELVIVKDMNGREILSNLPPEQDRELSGPGWLSMTGSLMNGYCNISIFLKSHVNPFSSLGSLNLIFLILIPIIMLFIMIITAFSRYLTIPIVKCKNAMLEIRNNNFGMTLENHYKDEIGELIKGFNDMSGDLALLLKQNAEVNASRREAEIDMLQQKVNPHFLYNTLEIINALILGGQNSDAVEVCELLGKIYHYNLMKHKWVSLTDECDYVKRYLLIVKHKMRELSVFWEVNEEVMDTDMLKLTIQPLVENSVLHGLRNKGKDACLTITIRPSGTKTEIVVMDNGSGIPAENLEIIEKTLESVRLGVPFDNLHIGIPNVYQRLYLEYGNNLEFNIESRILFGTKVCFSIPRKKPA